MRLRRLRRLEAGKAEPTRRELTTMGRVLDIPPWSFCLETDAFERLVADGEWPSREAIADARAGFAQLRQGRR